MTNPNHLHLDSPEHEQNRKDYQRLHRRDLNDRLTNPSRGQRRDISYNAKDFRLQLDFIRRLFYTITGSGNRTVYKMRQEEDNKDPILIKKDSIYDTVLNYFDDEIEPLFFDADGDLLMYVTNCVAEIYAPHTTERTVQNASKSRFANTYIPPTYKPKKQVSQRPIIWQQYLKRFMPDTELCWYEGNEQNKFPQQKYFEQWIAHRVQKPHEAPEVALILRGDQGTGKSFTFDNILREIVGVTNYEALNLKTIKGPFNAGVFKNVCIQIEEANTTEDKYASDRNKTAEKLKPLITQSVHRVEEKFIASQQQEKHFGLALTSNFDNPVLIEDTDRRYFVSWKSEKREDNKTFFNVMANWLTNEDGLQEMCDYLHSVNLDDFDFRNPPMTNQKKDLMEIETSAESKTDLAMVYLRSNPAYAFKLHSIQSYFKVSQYDAKQAMKKAGFERSARKRFIKGADAFSLWFHKDCPEEKKKQPEIWINENRAITIYPEMTEEAIIEAKEFISFPEDTLNKF